MGVGLMLQGAVSRTHHVGRGLIQAVLPWDKGLSVPVDQMLQGLD